MTFLLISHDLAVVAHLCETTAVMFRGRIVEIGPTAEVFAAPAHPYALELVEATPRLDRAKLVEAPPRPLPGDPTPRGCAYASRCVRARPLCREDMPILAPVAGEARRAACHFPLA